jgi:hypothetical protein
MAFAIRFRHATPKDVAVIAALHNSVAGALTAKYGEGHWSRLGNECGSELAQRHAVVRLGCDGRRVRRQ